VESQGPVATGQIMFLAHGQNTQASATLPGQTRKRVSQFVPADHFRYMSHGGMRKKFVQSISSLLCWVVVFVDYLWNM
jgi:hypothetical protein